ncbi:hypothetical protein [Aeromonas bivalvium]|uniref:hypothetical protein n=1 Tax=Aeromonas bivalvium TaxID=440079 RepID=UPI003D2484E6
MNRILIVGHSASGYQTVESVLQQRGMCSPLPSRREELLPQDITATLCKVHKAPPITHVVAEDDIEQLQVAPVWHGMAMDLMLGNLEQELWGWADPQAIYTLDYWAQLDDQLTFVLVYDEPQSALVDAAAQLDNLSAPDLEHLLGNWMAYNGALLHFFLRHTDRCLLVHAQQARHNTDGCLQKLQPLLSAPLLSLTGDDTADVATADGTQLRAYPIHTMIPAQKLTDVISLAGLKTTKAQEILQGSVMESYLLDQVLAEYPACQALYAELQSAASLPLQEPPRASSSAAQAWGALVQQRTLAIELANGLHEAYQGLRVNLEQTMTEQAKESELQLSQLNQIQTELEGHYLRKQELEQHSTEQSREIQRQAELVKQKEAEKSALNKALAEAQIQLEETKSSGQQKLGEQNAQLKMLREESELLLSHLHLVQEELEHHYQQKQELLLRNTEHSREIQRQAELAKQKEVEKSALNKALTEAQKQLELRNAEYSREVQRQDERAKQKEAEKSALNKALTEAQKLLEAAQSEGQQKLDEQHMQLKTLGDENSLLLSQLHQVQEELERYYLDNQLLKKQLPAPMYGSAQRVKQELEYRLGSVMIKRSRSLTGWLGMPWALAAERQAWRQHFATLSQKALPAIDSYHDAHEAERVKCHLSYRLGQVLIRNGKSPLGWVKLPFALSREVQQFRLQRKVV